MIRRRLSNHIKLNYRYFCNISSAPHVVAESEEIENQKIQENNSRPDCTEPQTDIFLKYNLGGSPYYYEDVAAQLPR